MSTFPLPRKTIYMVFRSHWLSRHLIWLHWSSNCLFEGIMMMDRKIKFIALQLFRNVEWRKENDSWFIVSIWNCHHFVSMSFALSWHAPFFSTVNNNINKIPFNDSMLLFLISCQDIFNSFFRTFVAFIHYMSFHLQCTFKA